MATSSARCHSKRINLVRYYGFFHCSSCDQHWQSAHTYCDPKTLKVVHKQMCKICKKSSNPFQIEPIKCGNCGVFIAECKCARSKQYTPKKHHNRSLCHKCLTGDICGETSYPLGWQSKNYENNADDEGGISDSSDYSDDENVYARESSDEEDDSDDVYVNDEEDERDDVYVNDEEDERDDVYVNDEEDERDDVYVNDEDDRDEDYEDDDSLDDGNFKWTYGLNLQ